MTLKELSLPLFWFPLVKKIIENLFSFSSELVLILDITHWQNTNILMISLALKKRALPIYSSPILLLAKILLLFREQGTENR